MKYIKKFEKSNVDKLKYQIGDYVICQEKGWLPSSNFLIFLDFIGNNIGQIVNKNTSVYDYIVKYENIPKEIKDYFNHQNGTSRDMTEFEIINHSKNKEKLETILNIKKFNI